MSRALALSTMLSIALVAPLVAQSPTLMSDIPAPHPASAVTVDTAVTFVKVTSQQGKLHGQLSKLLKAEAAKARVNGRTVFVNTGATWCSPCVALEAMLTDKRMIDAFSGTYLVHLDIDEWKDELAPLGFTAGTIPAIFAVDLSGRATSNVLRDTVGVVLGVEVAAPRIKRFVQAHLWKSDTGKTSTP